MLPLGLFVRSVREKQGKDGSVVAILFMTSLAIPKDTFYAAGDLGEACVVCDGGFAQHTLLRNSTCTEWLNLNSLKQGRICNPANPQDVFFNDMSPLDAQFNAS